MILKQSDLHYYFMLRDLSVFNLDFLFFDPSAANVANSFGRPRDALRNGIFETLFRTGTDFCDSSY